MLGAIGHVCAHLTVSISVLMECVTLSGPMYVPQFTLYPRVPGCICSAGCCPTSCPPSALTVGPGLATELCQPVLRSEDSGSLGPWSLHY